MVVSWVAVPSLFGNHYRAGPGRGWGGHQLCHCVPHYENSSTEGSICQSFFFFGVPLKEELSLNYKQTLMFHQEYTFEFLLRFNLFAVIVKLNASTVFCAQRVFVTTEGLWVGYAMLQAAACASRAWRASAATAVDLDTTPSQTARVRETCMPTQNLNPADCKETQSHQCYWLMIRKLEFYFKRSGHKWLLCGTGTKAANQRCKC